MIDTTSIKKGDYYSNDALKSVMKKKEIGPFDLMSLQAKIQHETGLTVKIESEGLRVLTSSEASEYNNHMFGNNLKRAFNRHALMLKVDRKDLPEDETGLHDRRIEVQGKIIQTISDEVKRNKPIEVSAESLLPKIFK